MDGMASFMAGRNSHGWQELLYYPSIHLIVNFTSHGACHRRMVTLYMSESIHLVWLSFQYPI